MLGSEVVDYLRMNLELSPNEYLATSRDVYETAMAYQGARAQGIEKAREEHRKQQDTERLQQESLAKLKANVGG